MMLGLAGLAALAGCHDLTAPDDGGELVTSASRREIVVTNATAQPVFTLILGRDLAARALIAPCVNEPRCPPLLPGATRAEQYPSASVAASESEAIAFWWYAVRGAHGVVRPDSVRSRRVALVGL